jgi:hypothetical protein
MGSALRRFRSFLSQLYESLEREGNVELSL